MTTTNEQISNAMLTIRAIRCTQRYHRASIERLCTLQESMMRTVWEWMPVDEHGGEQAALLCRAIMDDPFTHIEVMLNYCERALDAEMLNRQGIHSDLVEAIAELKKEIM